MSGTLLVLAGFLLGVQAVAESQRAPHRRARWTRRPVTRLLHAALRRGLTAAGLVAAAAASLAYAVLLAGLLVAAAARRAWVRSGRHRKKLLIEAFVTLCKRDPGAPREDLLALVLRTRHPEWDPEMIALMIRDHPRVDDLFDALVRLENQLSG